jgi:2-methylcitrate dehydratase PrpD
MATEASVASQLARFTQSVRYVKLPDAVRTCAAERIADTVMCMQAGATADSTCAALGFARDWATDGGISTVSGASDQLPAGWAAFVNATAAHTLELDDAHARSSVQAGGTVVAASLAVAEELGASGRTVVEAVVAGYEVALALGTWMAPRHKSLGFHPSSTLTTIGAAAAVCRLRELDDATTVASLTTATSFASGLLEFTRSPCEVNHIHLGRAALSGVMAVDLATRGIGGPSQAFEGRWGLAAAMTGGRTDAPWPGIDGRYRITEVATKPYPSCRLTHGAIDAAIAAHARAGGAHRIDHVEVVVSRQCLEQTDHPQPSTMRERQFSTQFGVATGLLTGAATLHQYREPDARISTLAERVRLSPATDDFDERAAQLRVTWEDGTQTRTAVRMPSGEPQRDGSGPHPYDLIRRRHGLDKTYLDRLFGLVAELPGSPSVASLATWLRGGDSPAHA